MKRLKKITSIVLSLMVILSGLILSTSNVSALEGTSGNCGDNATWKFDSETNTLTITGTGAMKDYEVISSPFYASNIQNLVIENGITSIGNYAFTDNELTSVTIPNSVTTIGDYAFTNNKLTSVTIPDSVTTIGDSAFEKNGLTSVTIPDSVTTIGDWAFKANQLTSVTIPNSVTTIGVGAFTNNKLTSVTIPTGVATIGDWAFEKNGLTSVTIPDSVTTIGNSAFRDNKLTSVTIPDSVTTIGYTAFASNDTLTKAVILNKNAVIGNASYNVFLDASSDFKLFGYANSTASTYATESGTSFVELKEITDTMISDIATQYFKGNAITPTLKINDGTKDLELDKDYTVSYKGNDKVGTATVIITGIGDYKYATATKTFEIKKQQYKITVTNDEHSTVTPSSEAMVDYDGSKEYVIKANDGYTISSVLVNGEEKISTLKNDTLTISNPTKDTTIKVISKADGKDQTKPTNPVDTNTNVNAGDNTQITLWLSLLGFSAFIALGYAMLNKKRKMN